VLEDVVVLDVLLVCPTFDVDVVEELDVDVVEECDVLVDDVLLLDVLLPGGAVVEVVVSGVSVVVVLVAPVTVVVVTTPAIGHSGGASHFRPMKTPAWSRTGEAQSAQ